MGGVLQRHPITVLLVWFFTVGQLIAFAPTIAAAQGLDLPLAPFVTASTFVGLLLPTIALTWQQDGRHGVRALGQQVARVRISPSWYALAMLGVPLLSILLAYASLGVPTGDPATSVGAAIWLGLVIPTAVGLVCTNLAEEIAWTGFVQARLQARHRPLIAAALTAPLFALQHLPVVLANAGSAAVVLLVVLTLLAIPFRAVMGWSYNRTGSLFLVGLIHAAGNAVSGGPGLGRGLIRRLYPHLDTVGPLHIFAFALLGLVVILGTRGRLGQ